MARRPRLDLELERYLVDGETVIVAVRLHWFHLARELLVVLAATVFAFWVDLEVSRSPGGELIHNASLLLWWGAALWLLWRVLNWRRDWFVATDKRFLLFYGFIRRRVAMMPLLKVTDMTYDRSLLGRLVGYGKFMLESAGQDQALSVIDHVPDADTHYRAICTQLFGPGSLLRVAPGAVPPQPPGDDDGPDDGGGPTRGPDAGGPAPAGARPEPRPAGGRDLPSPISTPESWYRSSNLGDPLHLGDTGEIPVVRVPRDDEDAPLYPPPHWSERG
ncbi:MAG TPA: PH domain-containing protein [Ornithinibacter sp.]|nr:PH domain-containing protein [Ornithinibacter sp.]